MTPRRRPRPRTTLADLTEAATTNTTHWACCRANRTLCGFPINPDTIGDCTVECFVCNDLIGLTRCPHDGKECPTT